MCLQEKETNNPQQFTEPAKASGILSNEQGTMQALFKKKKKKKSTKYWVCVFKWNFWNIYWNSVKDVEAVYLSI